MDDLKEKIEECFLDNELISKNSYAKAVEKAIAMLDKGTVRAAEWTDGKWLVNEWAKKAILLYFKHRKMEKKNYGYDYFDKIPLKKLDASFRVVPLGTAIRYGSFIEKGVIVMAPSYVNIGAYVDSGSMIDSHVLIGSCAQIGKNTHISAGVMIGGVLEPPQARPVIIEDGCFIGGQCGIYEGILIRRGAVLSSGVIINRSTPVFDCTNSKTYYGEVPENAVVVPGVLPKKTASGEVLLAAAMILKYRDGKTDARAALEQALR